MLTHLRPALVFMLAFTVVTGLVYPLAITGVAQLALGGKANGSLVKKGDAVIGSTLIGQSFSSDRYFHGRPSATSGPDPSDASKTVDAPYNASNSSGSNLGPTSKKLVERVEADVAALRKAGIGAIPADAVTASASGLDPHISPEFADLQVARIAAARKVPVEKVRAIVVGHVDNPVVGIIGEPRVNVLQLNLALDATP